MGDWRTLRDAAELLARPERVIDLFLDELSVIAPRMLFAAVRFEGAHALTLVSSQARIGGKDAPYENHAQLYARSAVRWNRWAVTDRDRSIARIEGLPREALGRCWSSYGINEHRRLIVAEGSRAIGLIGVSVIDDRAPDGETWDAIEQRMIEGAGLMRQAEKLATTPPASASREGSLHHEPLAYFAPDGTLLAVADGLRDSAPVVRSTGRLADNRWEPHAFELRGTCYELAPSVALRDHGGFVLSQRLDAHTRGGKHEAFFDALRRGLTNREIAVVLGVTPTAVKRRLERLFARYEATNRLELLHAIDRRD